jgi:glutamine synthetase
MSYQQSPNKLANTLAEKLVVEYVFIDAFNKTRSKTRIILPNGVNSENVNMFHIGDWTADGSSTGQSVTARSDVIIRPVALFKDPFNVSNEKIQYFITLCDVYNQDGTPHITNNRANLFKSLLNINAEKYKDSDPLFGIEQEYVIMQINGNKEPYGWTTDTINMQLRGGIKAPEESIFYCGVGSNCSFGREIALEHMNKCIDAGVAICGINAEVAPSQWEFQIGLCTPLDVSDNLWMARYILDRVSEKYNVGISYHPKPYGNAWNGSGGHTNFSTRQMREPNGLPHIYNAIKKLKKHHNEHMSVYGKDNNLRLTGIHETSSIDTFTYEESNRGSSIRIPAHVIADKRGYFEDRRPAANMDPYLVCGAIVSSVLDD